MSKQLPGRERRYDFIVYGVALILVGALGGYLLTVSTLQPPAAAPASVPTSTTAPASSASAPIAPAPSGGATMVDENQLKAYRDILAREPKNVQAAVAAGNMLYDAQRYPEAIAFYQQAFANNPSDISVSTDLGTALWYTGRADEALAQFERSLKLNATHPQTLFNKGVVLADGKHDYAAAAQTWETLLRTNPDYPNAAAVRSMMANANAKK